MSSGPKLKSVGMPALLLACLLAGSGVSAAVAHLALPAETLSGTKLTVPDDLPQRPIVFIIGFSKASRDQTSAWSRALHDKPPAAAAVVYSVSVIEDVPGFLRGFVTSGMRRGVPEALHDRFLVITQQSAGWRRLSSYATQTPDDAYVALMDTGRDVEWRTSGAVTEAKLQAVNDALEAHATQESPDNALQPAAAR